VAGHVLGALRQQHAQRAGAIDQRYENGRGAQLGGRLVEAAQREIAADMGRRHQRSRRYGVAPG